MDTRNVYGGGLLLSRAFAACIPLLGILWVLDLTRVLGLNLYGEQVLAGAVALALPAVFLNLSGTEERAAFVARMRLLVDLVLGFSGGGAALYLAWNYPRILDELYLKPLDILICSSIIVVVLLEATRRVAGMALTFIVATFLLYGLFGYLVPGSLQGRETDLDRLMTYLAGDSNGMLGMPLAVTVEVVIAFIFFGAVLEKTGGGAYFTNLSLSLLGRYTGGSAKIAITASGLFGSISGSAVANVASTGIVTIPLMRKSGYNPTHATAIESVASTGGQLVPPVMGAAAFLMAESLQVPYQEVVMAALIPALLYYVALYVQTDLLARRDGVKPISASEIPKFWSTFVGGLHYIVAFAILIGALFAFNYPPGEAALIASAFLLVVQLLPWCGGAEKGFRIRSAGGLFELFEDSGRTCSSIAIICAAAGLIIGVLNISTLGFSLTLALINLAHGNLMILLLLAALLSIILGMGMPTVGVYVLLSTLVAPAMVEAGVTPMSAHLFVLYFGMMSMITPPVAIAAFAAAAIGKTRPMATAWTSVTMGWTAYVVPFLFVITPGLLLDGEPLAILGSLSAALSGILLISSGGLGYFFGPLPRITRALSVAIGILCLVAVQYPLWDLGSALAGLLYLFVVALTQKKSGLSTSVI